MATAPTTPTINQQKLRRRIKKTIPGPKQHKWTQIGAKAIGGDQGALSRLTKRGLIGPKSKGQGGKGKKPDAPAKPKAPASTAPTLTTYKPPAITTAALEAAGPKPGATPGTRHDVITGLDVTANFGPNPYNPGGAVTPTKPKDPDIASQPPTRRHAIKRLGKALKQAQKAGDAKKVKKLRHHLRQLRRLGPGEHLAKPTIPQLVKQKKSAKKRERPNEVERLSTQIEKLRRRARGEVLVKGRGKNKGLAVTGGIGIAGQTQTKKKPTKKKK